MRSKPSRQPVSRLVAFLIAAVTLLVLIVPPTSIPGTSAQADEVEPIAGDVIVVLRENVPADDFAAAEFDGIEPDFVYSEVFDGFAAEITQEEAEALAADPNVVAIFENLPFRQAEQTVPTGVDRIDADVNPSSDIDGTDDVRITADIAVLDSGISSTTGDLNLVGGTDCTGGLGFDQDGTGHGTHVAGILGALDNDIGVVGVAPGARLWSVRVLNSFGNGSYATLICGLDWVAKRASTIEVANMSIEAGGSDGACDSDPLHLAICALVNDAGVPLIVAAGNGGSNAANTIPAAYDQVITVSNFADFDGQPGGLSTDNGCSPSNSDDNFATTSNYGPDVDIAGPGVCILSTGLGGPGDTAFKSGTSMAAPHVTGSAAIYLSLNPLATPSDVRAWLLGNAQPQNGPNGFTGDPDGNPEPVVWLGGGDPVPTGTATQVPTGPYPLVRSDDSPGTSAATYVRDGKLDKIWKTYTYSSPPADAWVWVDLGARKPVGTIRWVFGEAGIGDYFEIEGSNNQITWEYVTKRKGKPVGVWQEKTLSKNYRYIRFRFENPNGDLALGGLWEVQVWAPGIAPPLDATATPTNTPTATATVPPNGNYPFFGSQRSGNSTDPKAIWDGDFETTWQSDGSGTPNSAWVLVTLGSVKPIETIRWQYGTADIGDDLTIEISDDKQSWTTVHTELNTSPADVWLDVQGLDVSAKYVRWRFANPLNDSVIGGLSEVEVYGPGGFGGASERPEPTATSTPTETLPAPTATGTPELTATAEPTETTIVTETATEAPTETATGEATVESEASPIAQEPLPLEENPTEALPTEEVGEGRTEPTPYVVVQTSRSAAALPGTLAVDEDVETVWGADPEVEQGRLIVLTLDLGQERDIGSVRLLPSVDGLIGDATIETSTDDVTWTHYADPDGVSLDDDGWLELWPDESITEPVRARYVRVVMISPTDGLQPGGIAEIEMHPPEG